MKLIFDNPVVRSSQAVEDVLCVCHRRLATLLQSEQDLAPHVRVDQQTPLRASAYVLVHLGEPFGIADRSLLTRATTAGLMLDRFSHAIDDATDSQGEGSAIDRVHAGTLTLSAAVTMYAAICSDPRFWQCWNRYMVEASQAERCLWEHRGQDRPYGHADFAALGKKSALIKTNAALYASLSGDWCNLAAVETAIEHAATAVQLTDDLLDYEEDYATMMYTYPLQLARESNRISSSPTSRKSTISREIIVSVIERALEYLDGAKRTLRPLPAVGLVGLMTELEATLGKFLRDIATGPLRSHEPDRLVRHLRTSIDPRMSH